jgi:hypothetical protein
MIWSSGAKDPTRPVVKWGKISILYLKPSKIIESLLPVFQKFDIRRRAVAYSLIRD